MLFRSRANRWGDCLRLRDFYAPTFIVSSQADVKRLPRVLRSGGFSSSTEFIVKREKGSSGSGSFVTRQLARQLGRVNPRTRDGGGLVVQTYVPNPFLWVGQKFSLRTSAVVVSSDPFVAIYHDGILYLSLESYRSDWRRLGRERRSPSSPPP